METLREFYHLLMGSEWVVDLKEPTFRVARGTENRSNNSRFFSRPRLDSQYYQNLLLSLDYSRLERRRFARRQIWKNVRRNRGLLGRERNNRGLGGETYPWNRRRGVETIDAQGVQKCEELDCESCMDSRESEFPSSL